MADNLIFPVKFDLEAAVNQAQGDADRLLRKLQTAINAKPLAVNLKIGGAGNGSITEINTRMGELVKKWNELSESQRVSNKATGEFTPQAKKILAEYVRLTGATESYARTLQQIASAARQSANEQERSMARVSKQRAKALGDTKRILSATENSVGNVTAKLQLWKKILNSSDIGDKKFRRAATEVQRLTKQLNYLKTVTNEAIGKTQQHSHALSQSIKAQSLELGAVLKNTVAAYSTAYLQTFLKNVKDITAQFELQRISLGAIIQDQTRANQLFAEIKTFALKSPISILDLTKYTKQVAAYGIETEKLFDTTKRLADVSVGLGVDMGRIVLAYGQVKAASYLRAAEVRQFTEAGIPLLELLAQKFTELNGTAVTTEKVMDMISKRMVGFEMVEHIFSDLTSAGGMFFEMQEKQGNTLYGLWAKLADAASVMYDEIGNTSSINTSMRFMIQALTDLMRSWRDVARIVAEAGTAYAIVKLCMMAHAKAAALNIKWTNLDIAARQRLSATVIANNRMLRAFNQILLKCGASTRTATVWTLAFGRAINVVSKALTKTAIGIFVIGLGLLIDKLLFATSAAERLQEALDNISTENQQEQDKSVRNFERLANVVVSATSSYREQQSALDELRRTYKDIIPQERLTIENLKQMNGNYDLLTASIRRYISERMKQKQVDEIINHYGSDILNIQRHINDQLKNKYSAEQLSEFWQKFAQTVKESLKPDSKTAKELAEIPLTVGNYYQRLVDLTVASMGADLKFAQDIGAVTTFFSLEHVDINRIVPLMTEQEKQINALSYAYDTASLAMGEFAKSYDSAVNKITENGLKLDGKVIEQKDNPLLYSQQAANLEIKDAMVPTIKEAFKAAGLEFDEGWISLKDNVDKNLPQLTSTIDFKTMTKKMEEDSKKALADLQQKLNKLIEERNSYIQAIAAEEKKPKGGNTKYKELLQSGFDELSSQISELEERARKINLLPGILDTLGQKYDNLVPSDSVVKLMRQRFDSIVDYTQAYAKNMRRFRMDATEDMEAYRKRLTDEVDILKKNIKAWTAAQVLARLFRNKTEEQNLQNLIDEAELQLQDLEKVLGSMPSFDKERGNTSDPRLQNLKEEISLTKKLYDEYEKLEKQIGSSKAAAKIQNIYQNTIATLQQRADKYGFEFDLSFSIEGLKANLQNFIIKMKELQKLNDSKGKPLFPNIGKEIDESVAQLEDIDLKLLEKSIEKKLSELAERISRTKTAKEFYEKILRLSKNEDLAFRATFSVYGQDRLDTFADEIEQLKQLFGDIDISSAINKVTKQIDYRALRVMWETDKAQIEGMRKIPQVYDSNIKSMLDAGDKLSEKQYERWAKDLERARQYADKRIELAEYTATQIAEIEAKRKSLNPDRADYEQQISMYDEIIRGYREREKNEAAKLDYEQVKEQIGMFDDLGVRIGETFQNILNGLRKYTESSDFARIGLDAQKNVYAQIAKLEDRMSEGFQSIGVGAVSEYIRQYSTAASEYLAAQDKLRTATLAAIEADKKWEAAKVSGNEAAKSAALAEKQLADSRVESATASVYAASANLQRAQEGASRASTKFNNNLQKIESSLQSLNNGALKALWDLLGDEGKRSVGEFLSGSRKILSAIDKLREGLAKVGSNMGQFSSLITKNLLGALQGISPEDTEAIANTAKESLKASLSSVINDKNIVEQLSGVLSKSIGDIASQALSGVLSAEDAATKIGGLIDGIADAAASTGELWGAIISLVLSLLDEFAENGIGTFLGELLDSVGEAVEGILANLLTDSIPKILGGVGNVVAGVGTGIADLLTFGLFDFSNTRRVKKANKEIEKQQDLIDNLEYAYQRLEKAADKAFGPDFISNQKQQQKILLAEQQAFMKQYEAEMSKGKKTDKEKAEEYLNSARDIADQIADMQGKLAEKMMGTDVASAARDFANAWLEAYASFGNTTTAIKEKFDELIKSMVVESVMAKTVQVVLQPLFDEIEQMYDKGRSMTDVLKYAFSQAGDISNKISSGLEVNAHLLESLGVDLRGLYDSESDLKGISKTVGSATSEEINNAAAIGNTLMYYVSPIPRIDENLAIIRSIVERGDTAVNTSPTSVGWTDWQQQAMDNYNAISRNTAETVIECKRAADACEKITRAIKSKGATSGLNVFINS